MRPGVLLFTALAGAGIVASAARADEPIATAAAGPPPVAETAAAPLATDDQSPEAIGAWARGVMDGQPSTAAAGPARGAGCTPAIDRKPHGEVWAGVGTGGYREGGGVVTAPVGACGQVTVAIDRTDMGRGGWR
jgi:hypothetical protein